MESNDFVAIEDLNVKGLVKKSLSTRTHACQCSLVLCRDHNSAINILRKALDVVGHTKSLNSCGQINLCLANENLLSKSTG